MFMKHNNYDNKQQIKNYNLYLKQQSKLHKNMHKCFTNQTYTLISLTQDISAINIDVSSFYQKYIDK